MLADLNDGNGPFIDTWNVPNITMPSSSDLTALQTQYASQFSNNQLQSQGTAAIQNLLDTTAQSKQYNDALTCVTYATSTNAAWQAEAVAFIAWRDAVYASAISTFSQVESGSIPAPTIENFLAGLPSINWS